MIAWMKAKLVGAAVVAVVVGAGVVMVTHVKAEENGATTTMPAAGAAMVKTGTETPANGAAVAGGAGRAVAGWVTVAEPGANNNGEKGNAVSEMVTVTAPSMSDGTRE